MKKTKFYRKALAAVISASIIMCCAASAAAESKSNGVTYTSDSGYTATKISHPSNDVGTSDGIVDYTGNGTLGVNLENGEGDRGQNYTWGSIGYGDYMYIGTCYGSWLNTLSSMKNVLGHNYDEKVMMEALDVMFHGAFCTGEEDGVNFETITTDGFGDIYNHGCRAFGVTNEGLFVGTANPFYGAQVWKLSYGDIQSDDDTDADSELDTDSSTGTDSAKDTDSSSKAGGNSSTVINGQSQSIIYAASNTGKTANSTSKNVFTTGDDGISDVWYIALISSVTVLGICIAGAKRKRKE